MTRNDVINTDGSLNYNQIGQFKEDIATVTSGLASNVSQNKNTQHTLRRPIVTFITDDGAIEDWTKLKPLSETYGIPFVAALFTNGGGMSQEQILTLQDTYGWEIASHTVNHVSMATLATEAKIELECKQSKEILTERGYKVKNMVYPYGSADERVRRIAKKYYNCGVKVSGGVNTGVLPSFSIARVALGSYFDVGNTLADYKAKVDEAVAKNGWLVFMIHPASSEHDATQQSYLEQVIQYIQSLNVDVLTLDEGYKIFGNTMESGDYLGTTSGIAVSKDGQYANLPNNFQLFYKYPLNNSLVWTGVSNATLVTAFPRYVASSSTFTIADAGGFPTSSGTLTTYRLNPDDDFSFQIWYDISGSRMYRRRCVSGVWQAWDEYLLTSNFAGTQSYNVDATLNKYTADQLITAYPNNRITSFYFNAAGATGYPDSAGIVTTYRFGGNGYSRQEVRGYNKNAIWSRYVSDVDGSWTAWAKISAV